MTKTIHAVFDGQVLRPEEPLDIAPNTRVVVTVETETRPGGGTASFLRTAGALNLEGPSDWSERVDDYLYGNGVDCDG